MQNESTMPIGNMNTGEKQIQYIKNMTIMYCRPICPKTNANAGKIRYTQNTTNKEVEATNTSGGKIHNVELVYHVALTDACLYFPLASPQQGC